MDSVSDSDSVNDDNSLQATARGLAPSSVGARRSSARVTNFILIYYFLIIINFF